MSDTEANSPLYDRMNEHDTDVTSRCHRGLLWNAVKYSATIVLIVLFVILFFFVANNSVLDPIRYDPLNECIDEILSTDGRSNSIEFML